MATTIGVPASSLDIRLGQSPNIQNPQLNSELQGVYNALHILNAYTEQLRQELEGTDSQTPSESLRFRRKFEAVAAQTITAGNVISPIPSGMVNGIMTSYPTWDSRFIWTPSSGVPPRAYYAQTPFVPMIALTDASAGEIVSVGVPPGIIELPGAKCGQIIWAANARGTWTYHGATNGTRFYNGISSVHYSGLGALYLNVPAGGSTFGPGYYYRSGDYNFLNVQTFFPVAVCVADGYIMLRDRVFDNL